VFENRLLRRIFGPKRDEVTRKWRKLHNNARVIKMENEMGGACSANGGEERRMHGFGGEN
jgi:hypothetical protein